MRSLRTTRKAVRIACRVAKASASEKLFTWFGIHVTKLHIYGGAAGTLTLIDWVEGHLLYSCGVWLVAMLDMSKDISK